MLMNKTFGTVISAMSRVRTTVGFASLGSSAENPFAIRPGMIFSRWAGRTYSTTTPDAKNTDSKDVSVVGLSQRKEAARIPGETPRASVRISPDGSRGYVSNKIWVKSLQYLNVVTIAVGATASFACHPSTQYLWLKLFDLLTWPLNNSPETFQGEAYILNAVLGGVMIGWGTMMLLLSSEVGKSTKVRNTFLASLFSWYIIDSVGSGISGVPGNIVLNTTFLIAYLVPLLGISYNQRAKKSEEKNPDSSLQSGSSHSGFFARKEQDDDSDKSNASPSSSPQRHK
jgi:hypothetical protein